MNKAELKKRVREVIRARHDDIVRIGHDIFAEPELGYKERKTSAKVKAAFEKMGLEYTDGWGLTGVKARLKGAKSRRTVAFLGEPGRTY